MRAVATDYAVAGLLLHLIENAISPSEVFNLTIEDLSDRLSSRLNEEYNGDRVNKFVNIIANFGVGTFYDDPYADPIFVITSPSIRSFFQERASTEDVYARAWNLGLKWVSTAFQKAEFWEAVDREDVTIASRLPPTDRGPIGVSHNESAFKEADALLAELLEKLRNGNDLGEISEQQLPTVVLRVAEIKNELESGAVAMPSFGNRARELLNWIASQAAGAVVGTLATAAFVALLKVFEIPF